MIAYPDSILLDRPPHPIKSHSGMEPDTIAPQSLLTWLLDSQIVLIEEWEELPVRDRERIESIESVDSILDAMQQRHLLTPFQAEAVKKGSGSEIILGQYRLLDLLGEGGMGTVYRAEHLHLRREVAVKVMARAAEGNQRMVNRFYAEARAVARLQHPNIVTCFDAGRIRRPGPTPLYRDYFVMELIHGQDLFALVRDRGPLTPHRVCDIFRQVAEALGEAHRHGLIHRDMKPPNVLITPDWQAKVLDFGLARVPQRNVTEPGTLLGTVGYMAPEQARDPHAIDSRADLFSLGASMYWALTGREPYPETGNPIQDLHRRLTTMPPTVRQVRPEIPAEMSEVVAKLMHTDPDQRFPSARSVAATLTGFALWLHTANTVVPESSTSKDDSHRDRILIVEDDESVRSLMTQLLKDRYDVQEVEDAEAALAALSTNPPDLVVVDVNLPGLSGPELINQTRANGHDRDRVKVLLMSGTMPDEALGGLSVSGADDFLGKPFKPGEFLSRIRALLLRRVPQNPLDAGATLRLPATATVRAAATIAPTARSTAAAEAITLTVSRLLIETNLAMDGHASRITRYVRALAGAVSDRGEYSRLKDETFLDMLAAVAPIYDVGLLAVPRGLLMKPDKLDMDEQSIVQTHTTVGSEVLMTVAGKLAAELPYLPMAAEVARSHHERWDGNGYPDQLVGVEIPLSARVVSLVAVYEALRIRRPHRPPLAHSRAMKMILTEMAGFFDPTLLAGFAAVGPRLDLIHLGR
ncbi:MAG TPA: protein kinase [Gemmata sp.]|nr:protein kinase [Gemmata sp.]